MQIKKAEQEILLNVMQAEDTIPSIAQAKELRQISTDGSFDRTAVLAVLQDKPQKNQGITFKRSTLQQYFPKDYSTQQIEDIMITLLQKWNDENIAK